MFDIVFVDLPTSPFDVDKDYSRLLSLSCYVQDEVFLKKTGFQRKPKRLFYTPGILYLASYLKKRNIKCKYYNCNAQDIDFVQIAYEAKVVAFSTLTITYEKILKIAKSIKTINPSISVVLGGYHSHCFALDILQNNSFIDAIILGEGEVALYEYIIGLDPFKIKGLAFRKQDVVFINNDSHFLPESDIPIPDYSILGNQLNMYNINISTMRGCVGRCRFCVNPQYWGLPRLRLIDQIKDEFEYLYNNLPYGERLYITDNIFSFNKGRFIELCKSIAPFCQKFSLCCDIRSDFFDEEIADAMRSINVRQISIGFEDCNNGVLRKSSKAVSFENNVKTAQLIQKLMPNTIVYAYWLIGLPGTNTETLDANITKAKQLITEGIIDVVSAKHFIPYPGTEFFTNAEKYGIKLHNVSWSEYERKALFVPYSFIDSSISSEVLASSLLKMIADCTMASVSRFGISIPNDDISFPNDLPFKIIDTEICCRL